MDLNKLNREQDPHNIQYLLSVLGGSNERQEGDTGNAEVAGDVSIPDATAPPGPRRRPAPAAKAVDPRRRPSPLQPPPNADPQESHHSRLVSLSQSAVVLRSLMTLKRSQDDLERTLSAERKALVAQWQALAKSQVASSNSGSDGSSASPADGASSQQQKEKENQEAKISLGRRIKQWEEEALKRWEGQRTVQQKKLQELGVPTFHPSSDAAVLQEQRRALDELSALIEG